jgi:hypothetical protein
MSCLGGNGRLGGQGERGQKHDLGHDLGFSWLVRPGERRRHGRGRTRTESDDHGLDAHQSTLLLHG